MEPRGRPWPMSLNIPIVRIAPNSQRAHVFLSGAEFSLIFPPVSQWVQLILSQRIVLRTHESDISSNYSCLFVYSPFIRSRSYNERRIHSKVHHP